MTWINKSLILAKDLATTRFNGAYLSDGSAEVGRPTCSFEVNDNKSYLIKSSTEILQSALP
jgi:hypothetical protein